MEDAGLIKQILGMCFELLEENDVLTQEEYLKCKKKVAETDFKVVDSRIIKAQAETFGDTGPDGTQ